MSNTEPEMNERAILISQMSWVYFDIHQLLRNYATGIKDYRQTSRKLELFIKHAQSEEAKRLYRNAYSELTTYKLYMEGKLDLK